MENRQYGGMTKQNTSYADVSTRWRYWKYFYSAEYKRFFVNSVWELYESLNETEFKQVMEYHTDDDGRQWFLSLKDGNEVWCDYKLIQVQLYDNQGDESDTHNWTQVGIRDFVPGPKSAAGVSENLDVVNSKML